MKMRGQILFIFIFIFLHGGVQLFAQETETPNIDALTQDRYETNDINWQKETQRFNEWQRLNEPTNNKSHKKQKLRRRTRPPKQPLQFSYTGEIQLGGDQRYFVNSPYEFYKEQYGLIRQNGFASLSGELKVKDQQWQIIARPMGLWQRQQNDYIPLATAQPEPKSYWQSVRKAEFKELYGVLIPNPDFTITIGRQKFEWGPTELYNVSNPFNVVNPFEGIYRTFLIPPPLIRLSQSFATTWNITAIANLDDTSEYRKQYNKIIDKAYVVKLENVDSEGAYIVGATYGKGDITQPFAGLYGRWSHDSGFSIYFDAKQSWGSESYYPQTTQTFFGSLVQLKDIYYNDLEKKFITSDIGIRWENEWDLRLEVLKFEKGYNKEQIEMFPDAFTTQNPYRNLNLLALQQMHLLYFRQNYVYVSGRSPQFGPQKKYQYNFQFLNNNDDKSWIGIQKLERQAGDYATLAFMAMATGGDRTTGEFSNSVAAFYSFYVKVAF